MNNVIKYIPLSLFTASVLKSLIFGGFLAAAPAILIMGIVAVYFEREYQSKSMAIVHKRFDEIDKHLTTLYKTTNDIKSDVATAKLGMSARQITNPSPNWNLFAQTQNP